MSPRPSEHRLTPDRASYILSWSIALVAHFTNPSQSARWPCVDDAVIGGVLTIRPKLEIVDSRLRVGVVGRFVGRKITVEFGFQNANRAEIATNRGIEVGFGDGHIILSLSDGQRCDGHDDSRLEYFHRHRTSGGPVLATFRGRIT